jgi:putative endonuclease
LGQIPVSHFQRLSALSRLAGFQLLKKVISSIRKWWSGKTRPGAGPNEQAGTTAVKPTDVAAHIALGRRGEEWAIKFLERAGYRIVGANFALPIGRNTRGVTVNGEIDLVAYDGPTLCFIEVKTRSSDWFAPPEVNVDLRKQRQIARAARAYRRMLDLNDAIYRYDVLSVIIPPGAEEGEWAPVPSGTLLKNFWSDAKFRKRRWTHTDY